MTEFLRLRSEPQASACATARLYDTAAKRDRTVFPSRDRKEAACAAGFNLRDRTVAGDWAH